MTRVRSALLRGSACCGLAVAIALGCAGARRPVARPLADGDPRPAALVADLVREGEARRALRGVAKLAADGPQGSGRGRQIVLLERPARLRVEVLGPFDQTVVLLVTDGKHYRVVRSADRSTEQGALQPSLLAEVAGIALAPEDAVRVLLGAPVGAEARVRGGALIGAQLQVVLEPTAGLDRELLEFGPDARLRRWARLGADGEPRIEARYGDWRRLGGGSFPFEVELTDHASGARVRIVWSRVELDPALAPALFDPVGVP